VGINSMTRLPFLCFVGSVAGKNGLDNQGLGIF